MEQIFNEEQQEKAQFILNHPLAKLSDLRSNEIKDLAVVWCYYSGKIEGNTYTYVETEALLKDGITSEKKYEDAKMLKNLYNTFISELEYINKGKNQEMIDERTLFRVHQSISTGLVSDEESGFLRTRAVRINGSLQWICILFLQIKYFIQLCPNIMQILWRYIFIVTLPNYNLL